MNILIKRLFLLNALVWTMCFAAASARPAKNSHHVRSVSGLSLHDNDDTTKRKALLEDLLKLLPQDLTKNGYVSFLDKTFKDWLARTGELPPDFDKMPSIPYLPDPLMLDEGGSNIPVTSLKQWGEKRRWMKEKLQYTPGRIKVWPLKVYQFLGAPPNHVSIRLRDGGHGTSARDIEDYIGFFDNVFWAQRSSTC